jgi:hypothetical protein
MDIAKLLSTNASSDAMNGWGSASEEYARARKYV